MDNESLHPDLDGAPCAISDCLRGSDVVGHAGIQLSPLVGAVPGEQRQVIEFPLCVEQAHLLRMGLDNTLEDFSSGF